MNKLSKLLIGIFIFIFLFYKEEPGLNVGLFALATWLLTYINKSEKSENSFFWILSLSCFVSIFSFAWYGDVLSFFALFFSVVITVIYSQYPTMNLVTYPVIFAINILTFPFRIFYFENWLPNTVFKASWKKWVTTAIIPAFFLLVFALVYATGSDLFSDFFKKIFFDINFIQIFVLALLAFFILFNLWCLWLPRIMIRVNDELNDDFKETKQKTVIPAFSLFDKNLKRRGGEITFILLNTLLLVFIISYNYEQFFAVGGNSSLSDEIHQRIATVIVSILMAIGLILFYFKSKMNLRSEGKFLKTLSLIWILLNGLLVLSAFTKNGEYILNYGLTFKRISVIIFLFICLIGLFMTWYKIAWQKTNIFLINRMAWTLFFTFVINAPINYSWLVTKYNITLKKGIDKSYLQSLDYNKEILYNHFSNDTEWQNYFSQKDSWIQYQKNNSILSCYLYYKFLKLK